MKKLAVLWISLILIISMTACAGGAAASVESAAAAAQAPASSAPAASAQETLAQNSQTHEESGDAQWDSAGAVSITLDGTSIRAGGEGVSVDGSTATITRAGTYVLSGSLADGRIIVNTQDEETVRLVLNGVELASSSSAPLYIADAEKTVVILADGSTNRLSDAQSYTFDVPEDEEPNAVLFSKSDLTIAGSGSLSVDASFNDGIASKDGLVVDGANLTVSAADDGLRGKDYLVVKGGSLNVTAGGDGLKSDNAEEADQGYISIQGASITVVSGGDAIQAQTDLLISGGDFNLQSGGGSASRADGSVSVNGLDAAVSLVIDGGTFAVDSAADALHSNAGMVIHNGTFSIAAGDDGLHADASLEINGGEIQVTQSYEGLESAVITLNAGNIHVNASDDGINVAGGVDGSGAVSGQQASGSSTYTLTMRGGYVSVTAEGDGVDVNGAIEMSGGTLLVNGPTQPMNGALDYDAGFNLAGGTLVAAGSSGMAMAPGANSSQASVLVFFDAVQPAGTLVSIRNSAGEDILAFTPAKEFQSLAFSSAALKSGETYTVSTGGSASGTALDGLAQGGSVSGAAQYASFTVSGAVTTLGSGGMGPGMGGGRPGGGGPHTRP